MTVTLCTCIYTLYAPMNRSIASLSPTPNYKQATPSPVMISAFRRPLSRLTTLNHDMPRTRTLDLDLRPSRCPRLSRSSRRSRYPRSSRPSGIPGVLGDHPQSPTTTFYRHPPLELTPFSVHGPPSALRTDQRQSAHGSCLLVLGRKWRWRP